MRTWIATAVTVSLATSAVADAAAWSGECLPTIEPPLESLSALLEEIAPESSCSSADGVPFAIEPRVSVTEIRLPSYVGPRDIGQPSGEEKIVIASWLPFVTADEEIAPRPVFVINEIEPYRRAKQIHTQATSLVHESVSVPIGRGIGSLTFVGPKWQSWRAKSFTGFLDMGVEGIHSTALIAATGGIGIAYQNLKAAEDYWGTPLDVGHGTSELVDGVRAGDFDRAVDGYTEACSGVMLALSAAIPLGKGAAALTERPPAPSLAPMPVATPAPRYTPKQFAPGKLEPHFAKHASEFGAITRSEYLNGARALLSRDIGGDIQGAVRPNGDVLRYNSATNEFAAGQADGTIRTYFRPTDGIAYWKKQVGP